MSLMAMPWNAYLRKITIFLFIVKQIHLFFC